VNPNAMTHAQDPLAQLRDIHLPEPISWWPPAPGWWVLALLSLAVLGYGLYRFIQHRRNNLYRRQALAELELCYQSNPQPDMFSHQVLALLRRTSRAAYPLKSLASTSTEKFLAQISQSTKETGFNKQLCQQLAQLPYQQSPEYPSSFCKDVYQASRQWIKHHKHHALEVDTRRMKKRQEAEPC